MILLLYSFVLSLTMVNTIVTYKLAGRRKWLSVFCCCNALYQILIILDALSLPLAPSLYFIFLTLLFMPGPVLLAMTGTGLNKKLVSRRDFFALFIPALIVIVCHKLLTPDNTSAQYTLFVSLFQLLALISIFHTLSYVGLCLQQLHRNQHSWRPTPANADMSRSGFTGMLLLFGLMAIAQVFSAYLHPDGMPLSIGDIAAMLWSLMFNLTLIKFALTRSKGPLHRLVLTKQPSFSSEKHAVVSEDIARLIQRVNTQLESNYANPNYSIQQMASDVYLSPRQLQRRLRQGLGLSPSEYLKQFRLEKATHLLLTQSTQVAEVAYAVGFSSPAYFGTCFKQKYNQTPFTYQQKQVHRPTSALHSAQAKHLLN